MGGGSAIRGAGAREGERTREDSVRFKWSKENSSSGGSTIFNEGDLLGRNGKGNVRTLQERGGPSQSHLRRINGD